MIRRLVVVVSLVCLGATMATACRQAPAPRRPNIVLVVLDTLRADMLSDGAAGPAARRLAALATEGTYFPNAYTVGASTPPAMTAIMTGLQPGYARGARWTIDTWFGLARLRGAADGPGIPTGVPTLAERLRSLGYSTLGLVTNPFLQAQFGFQRGFDTFVELLKPHSYPTAEEVVGRAIGLLDGWKAQGGGAPVFLYVHLMDAHIPTSYRKARAAAPFRACPVAPTAR